MRRTLVLVIGGGASVWALVAGVASSSLWLGGLGALGLVASAMLLLGLGVKEFLDWFVSRTT